MKKTFICIVALAAIAVSSCKKSRACECSYTLTDNGVLVYTQDRYTVSKSKQTKKYFRQDQKCYSSVTKSTSGGVETVIDKTCNLR